MYGNYPLPTRMIALQVVRKSFLGPRLCYFASVHVDDNVQPEGS